MKKKFIGFYTPAKKQLDLSWNEGVFIFDTNCLLNLYRYSTSTKDDFLSVLEKIKDRIFYHIKLVMNFILTDYMLLMKLMIQLMQFLNFIKKELIRFLIKLQKVLRIIFIIILKT
jgi:hypothetical protein